MTERSIGPFAVLGFLLELCALAALGYAGFTQFAVPLSIALGLGLPLAAAVLWGLFRAPRRAVPTPFAARVLVEVVVMGGAALALVLSGLMVFGVAFAAVALVSGVVNDRAEYLDEKRTAAGA